MQGKAEDAGGLSPAKDDNAAMLCTPELLPGILMIAIVYHTFRESGDKRVTGQLQSGYRPYVSVFTGSRW